MKHTAATKRKLSKMRIGDKNPFYGKKHTAEAKKKMSLWTTERNKKMQWKIAPLSIKKISPVIIAYFAGILDGEGSIRSSSRTRDVVVYNTDRHLMQWLKKEIGGTVRYDIDKRGRQPCHVWQIGAARNVYRLLILTIPFLIIKKHKAIDMLRFLEAKYGDRING